MLDLPRDSEGRGAESVCQTLHRGAALRARWSRKFARRLMRHYVALVTFAACGPFWPSVISNSTGSPSCRLLYPSDVIAL